jgi:hypothetical protein
MEDSAHTVRGFGLQLRESEERIIIKGSASSAPDPFAFICPELQMPMWRLFFWLSRGQELQAHHNHLHASAGKEPRKTLRKEY